MGPSISTTGIPYHAIRNIEFLCKVFDYSSIMRSCSKGILDLFDHRFIVDTGAYFTALYCSALKMSISGVVLSAANKQMSWITTRWIITAMADLITFINGKICKIPGAELMSTFGFALKPKHSVSISIFSTLIFPTAIGLFNQFA